MVAISEMVAMKVFPACAGMSRKANGGLTGSSSFPRMRGDEPEVYGQENVKIAFSPHARG